MGHFPLRRGLGLFTTGWVCFGLVLAQGQSHGAGAKPKRALHPNASRAAEHRHAPPFEACSTEWDSNSRETLSTTVDGAPMAALGESGSVELNPWTTGLKRVLVMRVSFQDDPTEPCTREEAEAMMAGAAGFYRENSYGLLDLDAEVTPLLALPYTVADYAAVSKRHTALRDDAIAAAFAAGFFIADYDLDIVMNRRLFDYRATVNGRGCWLQYPSTDAAVHELGHNFGLGHANLWIGRGDTMIGPGRPLAYGNMFDAMAAILPGALAKRHFNAAHKYQLNWLPPAQVTSAVTSGVYRIHALDRSALDGAGPTALTVAKDESRDYWLECRAQWDDNPWARQGLFVYFGPWTESYGTSPLIDTTPNSFWAEDSRDAPLMVGRTFSDFEAGMHVTPLARNDSPPVWMDVRVVLGHFPDNHTPTVSVLADAIEVAPGTAVNWQAKISDLDGDETALSWDFGDESFAGNTNRVSKIWELPGEYLVRCWVSDMKGGAGFATQIVRVGDPGTRRISGRVTCQGQPLAGVRISVTDSIVTYTDANGYYTAVGVADGLYQLHPGKAYCEFAPASRVAQVGGASVVAQDFEAMWTDSPNNPPYVTTWTPDRDAVYDAPANVPLRAWVYDDGEVQLVQFYSETGLASMGQGNSAIEVWTNLWMNAPVGDHVVCVQAMDEFGAIGQSVPAHIQVTGIASRLDAVQRHQDGSVRLSISGPRGQSIVVEASGDLRDWSALAAVENATGLTEYIDLDAWQFRQRFYRTRTP